MRPPRRRSVMPDRNDSPIGADAPHREIAARYNRGHQNRAEPLYNVRRAELRKLFRRRLGDEPGGGELEAAIQAAAGDDWPSQTADELGRKINLRFDERAFLDIRTIAPMDVSFIERQEHYRQNKLERDRI